MKNIYTDDLLDRVHALHPEWDKKKLKKVIQHGCFKILQALDKGYDVKMKDQSIAVTIHTFRPMDIKNASCNKEHVS